MRRINSYEGLQNCYFCNIIDERCYKIVITLQVKGIWLHADAKKGQVFEKTRNME